MKEGLKGVTCAHGTVVSQGLNKYIQQTFSQISTMDSTAQHNTERRSTSTVSGSNIHWRIFALMSMMKRYHIMGTLDMNRGIISMDNIKDNTQINKCTRTAQDVQNISSQSYWDGSPAGHKDPIVFPASISQLMSWTSLADP